MRNVGTTRREGRQITEISARGYGPLYRVSFGTPTSESEDYWCDWCGRTGGRFFSFNDTHGQAETRDSELPGPLYCDLHCWGQETGATDL